MGLPLGIRIITVQRPSKMTSPLVFFQRFFLFACFCVNGSCFCFFLELVKYLGYFTIDIGGTKC